MMNKLYRKNELAFALIWIGVYVVGTSVADGISQDIGLAKSVTLALHVAMTAVLWVWMSKNGLLGKYGLRKGDAPASRLLFYVPLAVVACLKLVHGVRLNFSPAETATYVLSMLCVGFLEEVILRGLLFRAMARDNLRSAVIVSSVTFGLGHIVNLFNASGQSLADTLCQIVFAVMVGFALVLLLLRGGSLWPCVVFHSLNNALSAFSDQAATVAAHGGEAAASWIHLAILIAVGGLYALYLWRLKPAEK